MVTEQLSIVLACAAAALVVVLVRNVWLVARNVVTIAHEGGHALVALLVGRTLSGVQLHSDTSGVTVSRGKPHGPGMVATTFAGYITPSLVGLGFAALLTAGKVTALLWTSIVLLAAMLVMVRNAYGVVSIVVTGLVVFAISRFTTVAVQAGFAYFFTWFLLFAGIKPIWELQRKRSRVRSPDSDADQLARLTRIPGLVWVFVFGLVAIAALALSASWLVPFGTLSRVFGTL
ncbi:MAG TPA: M50 family metallopeptidase [Pseudonocardiaceae bacterium]|jgi:hypothetical protein|nr:M50 family metallopeptidase [Pseudonocardiaceae bacterium]